MLIQVVGDLQQKPKSGSTSSPAVAENCLYIIANVSCKVYLSTLPAAWPILIFKN